MALRAWLSSRLKAVTGTSSPTGRTATVDKLLAGLVTSAGAVTEGRLRVEPGGGVSGAGHWGSEVSRYTHTHTGGGLVYLKRGLAPAAGSPGSSGPAGGSDGSPPVHTQTAADRTVHQGDEEESVR